MAKAKKKPRSIPIEQEAPSPEQEHVSRLMHFFKSLKPRSPKQSLEHRSSLHNTKSLAWVPILPDQYIYAIDYARNELYGAQGFERVLGYKDEHVDLPLTYSIIHPDDIGPVAALAKRALELLFSEAIPITPLAGVWSVDYRIRKSNGEYIKVLRQVCVLSVEKATGKVASTLSVCKDISNIKTSNLIGWQYTGPHGTRLDMSDIQSSMPNVMYRPSRREFDVLLGLAAGKSSTRIALDLNISRHTVDTHRKNLLARSGTPNVASLIALASGQGWV